MTEARPAFYALAPGGWRDYVTLLHVPYTLWNLSYVAIGAALSPRFPVGRTAAALAAFALALGVSAHALDELHGRPLRTRISRQALVALALVPLAGAVAIGVAVALAFDLWLLAFVVAGAFLVCAYNLELAGGRLHNDATFAIAWGAFPLLTGYFEASGRLDANAVLGGAFAAVLSLAQRRLSTQVRDVRRRVRAVAGTLEREDGTVEPLSAETVTAVPEAALRLLAAAVVLLAATLVAGRLL